MKQALTIMAGKSALRHLQSNGLQPDHVSLMPGAAGGAKWLVLKELDQFIFGAWMAQRSMPMDLIGSSIGSWRLVAGMLGRTDRLFDAYLDQSYSEQPDSAEITLAAERILDSMLGDDGEAVCVAHPTFRLSIMTARCSGPLASEMKSILIPGLSAAAVLNLIWPPAQQIMFRRHMLQHPDSQEGWARRSFWQLETTPLSLKNIRSGLIASGSIPVVLKPVNSIDNAPDGVYRDGGLGDYHMPLDYSKTAGVVLFPHFSSTFKAGWFDKQLPWRRISRKLFDNVVQVYPSDSFIAGLPYSKIPDRNDFINLDATSRAKYWRTVESESVRLVDELATWLEADCPVDRVGQI